LNTEYVRQISLHIFQSLKSNFRTRHGVNFSDSHCTMYAMMAVTSVNCALPDF